ncbi:MULTISPECIES: hypothetical protein [Bacillus]|uniref:hypothetical protein n=1 Tax=Bacillus TaxID=1386 RepID=UPI0002DD4A3F|nr:MULTISPECIES: hypothetical protein [Bacillus]MCW1837250.1 hypothetical protein [Bacillus xiamenensis]QGX67290.1 hypothetical protein GPA07_18385 [Bacillus sp. ms-22]
MEINIGQTMMEEAILGIAYQQMANETQWRKYEDAMNRSQATIVKFQLKLALSS